MIHTRRDSGVYGRCRASGPDKVGSRVLRLFLVAGRNVRQMLDTPDVRPGARVSFIAPDHDHDALDAAAGCEYVDDQIRLQE